MDETEIQDKYPIGMSLSFISGMGVVDGIYDEIRKTGVIKGYESVEREGDSDGDCHCVHISWGLILQIEDGQEYIREPEEIERVISDKEES